MSRGSASSPLMDFVAGVLAITGATDTKLFWLAQTGDTTTSITKDADARTVTWDGDVSSRLSALGFGYTQSFNGSTNIGTVPDTTNLSFGNGTTDGPMSIVSLGNVTDNAANKIYVSKDRNQVGGTEYLLRVGASEQLRLQISDNAARNVTRTYATPIGVGAYHLVGASYSAATGGATAGNDMVEFVDGASVASSAVNNASYTAMSNTTADVHIGGRLNLTVPLDQFLGSLAFVVITAKNLVDADHASIKALVNTYYGLAL